MDENHIKLEDDFKAMLLKLNGNKFKDFPITALFPRSGMKYNHELMVIGRAINHWGEKKENIWSGQDNLFTEEIIKNIISKDEVHRLSWIFANWEKSEGSKFHKKTSAFWRVIKRILKELEITNEKDWSTYLTWSNLYKVGPANGGNPSSKLREAQCEDCVHFLASELAYFKPKRILFLTGYNWFCYFEKKLGFTGNKSTNTNLVDWIGNYNDISIVVAKHPQGKNETRYVNEVVNSFKKN